MTRSTNVAQVGSADTGQVLVECWAVNERANQLVLEHLDVAAWRARTPGSKTRTIAAIATHMQNIRRKWLRLSVPHFAPPVQLNRASCTQQQARQAFAESGQRCGQMIAQVLTGSSIALDKSRMFHRDGWAKPWPAGAAMVTYMITHEAHHRGQICMLAHQLGYPLPGPAAQGIWVWEKLWKDCGFTHPR